MAESSVKGVTGEERWGTHREGRNDRPGAELVTRGTGKVIGWKGRKGTDRSAGLDPIPRC